MHRQALATFPCLSTCCSTLSFRLISRSALVSSHLLLQAIYSNSQKCQPKSEVSQSSDRIQRYVDLRTFHNLYYSSNPRTITDRIACLLIASALPPSISCAGRPKRSKFGSAVFTVDSIRVMTLHPHRPRSATKPSRSVSMLERSSRTGSSLWSY